MQYTTVGSRAAIGYLYVSARHPVFRIPYSVVSEAQFAHILISTAVWCMRLLLASGKAFGSPEFCMCRICHKLTNQWTGGKKFVGEEKVKNGA